MTTRLPFGSTTSLLTAIILAPSVGLVLPPATAAGAQTQTAPSDPSKAPASSGQTTRRIRHDPLTCVTTVSAARVEAEIPETATGYVYFRAAGTSAYYFVAMTGPEPRVQGVLPRALPETRAVDYSIQTSEGPSLVRNTAEYSPPVASAGVCSAPGLAVGRDGAGLTVGMTDASAPPIPPGFNKADIVRIILVGGAVVPASAAGDASGAGPSGSLASGASARKTSSSSPGGLSNTALIVTGASVATGIGIGVLISKSGGKPTATPTPTPSPTRTPTRTPVPNRFIQVEATWSGVGNVDVRLFDPSQNEAGQRLPANCESASRRTERVVLQGTLPPGPYRVTLEGGTCGLGTPVTIPAMLTITTDTGPVASCSGVVKNVAVGGVSDGCSFTVP
ncbi:MAG TPA: hypothetical protein VGO79_01990 [Thermoanaerobaculia bacterium]